MVYRTLLIPNTDFNTGEKYVLIPSKTTLAQLKDSLSPHLKSWDRFEAAARQKKYASNIKPGRYRLVKGMSNNDMINILRSQNVPVAVSFNNQETLEQLAGRIAVQVEADSISLLNAFNDELFLSDNQLNDDSALTVYIPNTYEFFWNTSAESFRDRMMKEYKSFWNKERREKAKAIGLSPLQVLSLAAIVHKETAMVEERPRVAGVYLNRLKRNMLLQADPTVIFALKKELGNQDTIIKRVLYKDLEIDSPYNTYKYAGIPPGPIAMPDISAIDAVLNAENHDFYYFVADVETFGYHKFASTLAQHNRNKAQYIRWINSQKINR